MYSTIMFDVKVEDGVALVTHSGEDGRHHEEIGDLAIELAKDDAVRSVLFSGWETSATSRAKRVARTATTEMGALLEQHDEARRMVKSWLELDKPVVAAVEADMINVPTYILMTDIVVAERHVRFSDVHVPLGVVSATQPFLWPLSSGLAKAKRYILTGDSVSAEEAEKFGLIAEVVDTGKSYERALEHAQKLASFTPHAVQLTKRALNNWQRAAFTPVFEHALALELMTLPEAIRRRPATSAE
jgi:enoyl-CoA hydratase